MEQIQVTVSQLSDSGAQLKSLKTQLKSMIDETDSIVNQLQNDWEGEAADAFQSSYKTNSQKLNQATEGIQSFISALDRILEEYKRTEANNVRIANSMK